MKAGSGRLALALMVGCVVCLAIPGAALAGTLDQQQTLATGPQAEVYSNQAWAQTFTAGLSGGLDQVDLNLAQQILGASAPTTPLTVELRNVSGGAPGGTVLGTQSVAPTTPPVYPANGFVSVSFSPTVPVVAGTQYAIVASTSGGSSGEYGWYGAGGDTYTRGDPFFQQPPGTGPWTMPVTLDLSFKTYVATSTPPGPTGTTGTTGERAAAKKRCKKKFPKGARRTKCLKKAKKLPV
jgi:hypothetical protein